MARMLTRMGHEVTVAEDGQLALERIRVAWSAGEENFYDAIVSIPISPYLNQAHNVISSWITKCLE